MYAATEKRVGPILAYTLSAALYTRLSANRDKGIAAIARRARRPGGLPTRSLANPKPCQPEALPTRSLANPKPGQPEALPTRSLANPKPCQPEGWRRPYMRNSSPR